MYRARPRRGGGGAAPTVDGNLLVGEELEELRVHGAGLALLRVALGQHGHHVGRRLVWVRALRLVRARLVRRPAPAAADDGEGAAREPANEGSVAAASLDLDVRFASRRGPHLRARRRLRAAAGAGASPARYVASARYTLDTMRTKPSSGDFCHSDDESTTV